MSVQVIPNLSSFTSEGDNRADALCRLAVITDGISVRVRKCVISEFRLSQTPVAVLKMRVATSQTEICGETNERDMCSTEDVARHQPPWINTSSLLHLYWILRLSYYFSSFLTMSERGRQTGSLSSCGKSNETSVSDLKYSQTNGLISLVAMICISWGKQCMCSSSESCSVNSWTVSVAELLPPSGALRNWLSKLGQMSHRLNNLLQRYVGITLSQD